MKYEIATPSGEVVATADMPAAALVAETLSPAYGPLGVRYAPSDNKLVPSGHWSIAPKAASEWSEWVAGARKLVSS